MTALQLAQTDQLLLSMLEKEIKAKKYNDEFDTAKLDRQKSNGKAKGVSDHEIDKQFGALKSLLDSPANSMTPVENWATFAERNGVNGAIQFFPYTLEVKVNG